MSKMFIGYLAGMMMMIFVYVVIKIVEPVWLAFMIIGLQGGLAGGLISAFEREREG